MLNKVVPVPVLEGPEITLNGFRFACRLPEITDVVGFTYDVVWAFDGEELTDNNSVTVAGGVREVFLDQQAWIGHVGSTVRIVVIFL